ncbi:MAG: hypothetical protein NWE99_06945 [Candidatus Bathyarchaeota archaeon]|nr:hypothetical protein [Candidatus Bathyarchaeota archaeon]
MSKRKRTTKLKPKKVDLLELSDSKRLLVLQEAKENLRQRMEEAKVWQSFAENDRVTINGQTIDFENGGLTGLAYEELPNYSK